MKTERPWYKGVHSQVLQDVLKRLDNGYKAFFRRVKEGTEAPGFPKFKKRGNGTVSPTRNIRSSHLTELSYPRSAQSKLSTIGKSLKQQKSKLSRYLKKVASGLPASPSCCRSTSSLSRACSILLESIWIE